MAEMTVVCARVTGHGPGMAAVVVVADRQDLTWLAVEGKSGENIYFDAEFKRTSCTIGGS